MTERDTQLANLARELHSTRKLSPMQIRQLAGFLDSTDQPYIPGPIETIQNWLDGAASRTPSQPAPAQPREADDTSALHAKIALLEAQLRRLSFEASSTPSLDSASLDSPRRSDRPRSASPLSDNSREVIAELKQVNSHLLAQLATTNQLVVATLGVVDGRGRDPAPAGSSPAAKPFKDWLQQVEAYASEAHRAPEAFLAQFYLYAWQNNVPSTERACQLIGKLTGAAQTWYTRAFTNDPAAATESQIRLGLRKAFGQEYAGARALRAMFQLVAQVLKGCSMSP